MTAIIVVIKPEQDRDEWMQAMRDAALSFSGYSYLERHFRVENVTIVTFPLVNHPGYESMEPAEMPISSAATQEFVLDESLQSARWALARIIRRRAPWPTNFRADFPQNAYYRCTRDGSGVDIYVIDSGIRTTHEEFGGRALNVYNTTGTAAAYFHGTACASMAAGVTMGMARDSQLFSFQCVNSLGQSTNDQLISCIEQALSHYAGRSALNRPAVVNMSLINFGAAVNAAIGSMIDAGMVCVICAGNDSADLGIVDAYPAESDADAIVVGGAAACDIPYFNTTSGSNYGARVDLCAPSQANYYATNTGDAAFGTGSGTSFGTAHTSGAIACLLEGHPRLTSRAQVQAVRNFVISTATTGKFRPTPQQPLPDRLLYLNPDLAFEAIPGL